MRLFVNGKLRARKRGQAPTGAIQWYGRFRGHPVRPRLYRLELLAVDEAGNRSKRVPAGPVRVRYVELGLDTIRCPAGTRFGVRVHTDARRYSWLFARGRGRSSARYLVLRAPRKAGSYRLFVERAATERVRPSWSPADDRRGCPCRGDPRRSGAGGAPGRDEPRGSARRARCGRGRWRPPRGVPRAERLGKLLAAPSGGRLPLAAAGAFVLRRWPWLLPLRARVRPRPDSRRRG